MNDNSDLRGADDTVAVNSDYYNHLYQRRRGWIFRLRGWFSFDQQSKAKPSYQVSRALLEGSRSAVVRVLDYGCGWGSFLLKWRGHAGQFFCYDLSIPAMDQVVTAGSDAGVSIAKLDGSFFTESSGNFDLILCSHVMEHVPDDGALFRSLTGNLRPGGFLLVNVPINEVWKDPKHVRTYSREQLSIMFADAGLKVCVAREFDRWTAFFLTNEQQRDCPTWFRFLLRGLRAVLAVIPYSITQFADLRFLHKYAPQQLLMAGQKS